MFPSLGPSTARPSDCKRTAATMATRRARDEVQAFFDAHKADFDKNQRKIQQTLEAIRTNAAYLERFTAGGALSWLQAYKAPVPVA